MYVYTHTHTHIYIYIYITRDGPRPLLITNSFKNMSNMKTKLNKCVCVILKKAKI
jgi:hypothetical protein